MARILLEEIEIDVAETLEDVMGRIVDSRDGLRLGSGAIVAPPGWIVLTALGTGDRLYFQVARIGCVRED